MASDGGESVRAPFNFSWVVQGELAAMGWPQMPSNLRFLEKEGVKFLVTLSPEMRPPIHTFPNLKWSEIPVQEFRSPSVSQIKTFIDTCQEFRTKKEAVGVHCRMGQGRTGVMAACFLVYFYGQSPERAITNVRLMRPGSVETYEQEKAVIKYYDYLQSL
jgi:atypical dual specificity phosphatase